MFNLEASFAVQDVLPVPDPWGMGVTLEIARAGCAEYQTHLKTQQKKNPLSRIMIQTTLKVGAMSAVRRKPRADDAYAVQLANEKDEEAFERELEKNLGNLDVDKIDLDSLDDDVGFLILLRGWSGMKDAATEAPVPFDADAAMKLANSTFPLPKGVPYGPTRDGETVTIGQAVRRFVREKAGDLEAFRAARMVVAAGESNALPAGASDAGQS